MIASKPVWTPRKDDLKHSSMSDFLIYINGEFSLGLSDYWDLYDWSIKENFSFWKSLAKYFQIKWHEQPYETYNNPKGVGLLGGRWFPGGTLNYAEHLLEGALCETLVTVLSEDKIDQIWSRADLKVAVAACAHFLKQQGVSKGDRVVGVVTNSIESLIAMLATSSLGAVWSSCSPDFGLGGILDRFAQIEPKVLFFTTAYQYNGKKISCVSTFIELLSRLPFLNAAVPIGDDKFSVSLPRGCVLHTFDSILCQPIIPDLSYVPVSFSDPLFILFSSGTTGVPKCIVHSVGGTLLQHLKELALHCDLKPAERLLYFTTCGWMMWNWMVSALATGAEIILFDGSPSYPDLSSLWQACETHQVTILGTSPKFLAACAKEGVIPKTYLSGKHLRTVLATGAPLLPEQFDWVSDKVHEDVQLCSISGGTDIISCFMLGVPTLPVYRGEIQAPGLGMAVESWKDGQRVWQEKGELVCTKPFPSMPLGFWNDPDQKKFRKAYFSYYQDHDVWHHGDYICISEHRGVVVLGRSDATLNPGGVRIGTAEIYRAVQGLDAVEDSLAVSRQVDGDAEIILFVQVEKDRFHTDLITSIKNTIREQLTPRHVPRHIFRVSEIPFTRSGKKLELAVTNILAGDQVVNESSIANPDCLNDYRLIASSLAET